MSNYKDYSLVWNEVLDSMYQEIGSTSFEIWFSRVKFSSFHDNIFCIIVPDSLTKEWIESRYLDIMQNKLRRLIDPRVVLSIRTEILSGISDPVSALNPKYTFDTFVVGNSNRFAHAACYAVGESPFKSYNPLFIYGGVGLGKTHLMQAIGHHILSKKPNYLVMYVSSEQFTNDMISSIKDDTTSLFRNKYRSIDVLLVDDIQFLAGKERTQEEFFHTFNTLHESNKQVVISSDRPPRNIPTLEDRLRSRFEWGLITDIQPPDLETRIAILRKKAQGENLNIPYSVLDYIANYIDSNIRELEGALIRLVAFATINNKPLDMNTAVEALKDIMPPPRPRKITIETIQKTVAAHYHLEINEIVSKKRNKQLVYPRHIAMYLCRKLTDASFPQIGEQFGGRDHTTVMHAHEKLVNELLSDRELVAEIELLCKKIDPNYIV
ncbi:chromosomal replication initiator protein DnaA [Syntrophomonas wolfei]|jgi:chromosomal replication initiator protein|uniref:chromosomal replication initiator protein DnaA n=1 Tax=Syntrophomonas wolfei TaxID=863 RepID=UPI000772EEA1|nr:chromosomal replication initiator protein DnaA [Syntrophomonas wolfei]